MQVVGLFLGVFYGLVLISNYIIIDIVRYRSWMWRWNKKSVSLSLGLLMINSLIPVAAFIIKKYALWQY